MVKLTDIRVTGTALFFLPVKARVPLKFGAEIMTEAICARVRLTVTDQRGRRAEGWGETPLSVQWAWPGKAYLKGCELMKSFCQRLASVWAEFDAQGHPIELGHDFQQQLLAALLRDFNRENEPVSEPMPWLAALICCSAFDLALHDAYGMLHERPVYETYGPEFMNRSLGDFLTPLNGSKLSFKDKYPQDFLIRYPPHQLPAWHLVGGLDSLTKSELTGAEPDDGYPILLNDWIQRDGLKCLKVKLRGNDSDWDYQRLVRVGRIAMNSEVDWLSADFNCTVAEPRYVNDILDRLRDEFPRAYGMVLYVEQPFAYDLECNRIDVRSVAARKPLFLDESAHDWKAVRLGRELGWTGVALKTCKTQTGALLTACWAKAHDLSLMVQDLTNPMLAMIPHVLLAARVGTIMGVETNSMQFYPEASAPEAAVHPGLYRRRNGRVNLSSTTGPGFGYRLKEIGRELPKPVIQLGQGA